MVTSKVCTCAHKLGECKFIFDFVVLEDEVYIEKLMQKVAEGIEDVGVTGSTLVMKDFTVDLE